jgi:hypothetical protein
MKSGKLHTVLGSLILSLTMLPSVGVGQQSHEKSTATSDKDATRAIMAQIFTSLTKVLPLTMSVDDFSKEANRPLILQELKQMSESTGALAKHTKSMDASFSFVAKSLTQDLKDIYGWYSKGATNEARYLLHQISENCVSCHMKLPDPGHAPRMDAFFKDVSIQKLSAPEKAKLQVALRQFDDALATWETLFKSQARPSEIYAMDSLTEYLKVCLRVKSVPDRALQTLNSLSGRGDVPRFMQREVSQWKTSLTQLKKEIGQSGKEIERSSKILKVAKSSMEYPMDRSRFVDFVVASALLNRAINDDKKLSKNERAQAYYLLGTTESVIGRSAWLSQTDYYFESAIRTAPQSKFAKQAYEALEQQVVLEYSGSAGTSVPEDVDANLKELKHLIEPK